ncbi:MAG: FG-GAP repeat protein, partial [Gemmatimonadota bacterium]|nr:FG-GAP repeat protein [Gemmatimonadota bacterium]
MRTSASVTLSALMLLAVVGTAEAQSMRAGSQSASGQQAFGATVAVSGGRIFVGEPANQRSPGFVYAYGRDGSGAWSEIARLAAPDAQNADGFGGALAIEGNTLVTASTSADGAGAVFVYSADGGGWSFAQKISASDAAEGDEFGSSVALAGDHLLVGAWAANDSTGAVYAFTRDASGTWTESGKISGSESVAGDRFGVVLTMEGDLALVSATRAEEQVGAVYAFGFSDGAWSELGKLEPRGLEKGDRLGSGLLIDGETVYASTERVNRFVGSVYAFRHDAESGDWNQVAGLQPFDAAQQTRFGVSLAASDDELWVGAIGSGGFAGSVYRFARDG